MNWSLFHLIFFYCGVNFRALIYQLIFVENNPLQHWFVHYFLDCPAIRINLGA